MTGLLQAEVNVLKLTSFHVLFFCLFVWVNTANMLLHDCGKDQWTLMTSKLTLTKAL